MGLKGHKKVAHEAGFKGERSILTKKKKERPLNQVCLTEKNELGKVGAEKFVRHGKRK